MRDESTTRSQASLLSPFPTRITCLLPTLSNIKGSNRRCVPTQQQDRLPGTQGWIRRAGKALALHPTGSQAARGQGSTPAFECKKQLSCAHPASPLSLIFSLIKHFCHPLSWSLPRLHPVAHTRLAGWSVLSRGIPGLLRSTSRH